MAESCHRSSNELVTNWLHRNGVSHEANTNDSIGELGQRLREQQQQQLEISDTLEQLAAAEARLTRLEDRSQDQVDQEA